LFAAFSGYVQAGQKASHRILTLTSSPDQLWSFLAVW